MDKTNYLIVGAGVTGLSFANFIDSEDYLIIERENEPGGYCRSIKSEGFIWDYAGHFLHFRKKSIKNFLLSRIPDKSIIKVRKNAKIFYKDRYIDYPFQKNIHQLEKQEFIDCLYDLYFRSVYGNDRRNFQSMLYQNFGKSISEKFLIPYNEKVYAGDLSTFGMGALGRFFPYADLDEIVSNFKIANNLSYNDIFYYPKNGAIQIIQALLSSLNQSRIIFNEQLLHIDCQRKIATTSKRQIKFEYLISTIPFPHLLSSLEKEELLDKFTSNKVLVFNLGFNSKGNKECHWIYFPEKKYRFYRIGYYDNIVFANKMSLYVEIGLPSKEAVNHDLEFDLVIQGLKTAGVITDQELVAKHFVIMNPGYVHINDTSKELYNKISTILMIKGIFSIGRYGGWRYCSIEDNIIEAKYLASVFKGLNSKSNL
jgi:protoporphyrinogen oxidase